MAASMNKAFLIGNLGKDPEVRFLPDGSKVVNLTLATNETWSDKNTGERRTKTEWHRVVVFNDRLADICEKYLKKGSKIFIEGQIQTRKYTDQTGVERYSTEIVLQRYRGELGMLDGRGPGHDEAPSDHLNVQNHDSGHSGQFDLIDDEVPF